MIAYARLEITVLIGKVSAARSRVRIEKPQRVVNVAQPPAAQRPLRYLVMYGFGTHVVYALHLIGRALELARRKNHVAHGVIPAVFAALLLYSVHNDRRYRAHTRIAFATGFALDKPCKQFQFVHAKCLCKKPRMCAEFLFVEIIWS